MAHVQVGAFDDVDRSGESDALVQWMSRQRSGASARQAELLGARPGERVLDFGCGPGTDLALFAEAVGDGLAVGIDRSYAMAGKAAATGAVQCCDAEAVGLRSAQFEAAWVRAVLVHVQSPAMVLKEVMRLLRPGGRVVVVEPDHGTHIAGPCDDDVFERVRQHRVSRFRNAKVGRSLKHLLVTTGYEQVSAQPAVLQFDDFAVARAAGGPFDRAVEDAVADGVITGPEGQEYLSQLQSASDRGAFFFAATSVVAVGRRPHCPRRRAHPQVVRISGTTYARSAEGCHAPGVLGQARLTR